MPVHSERRAYALAKSYEAFGQILLQGVTEAHVPFIRVLGLDTLVADDPEQWAVDHHSLFGMNVFPYESVFLGNHNLVGGEAADAVFLAYQNFGFQIDRDEFSPDHAGFELQFLAHLCRLEDGGNGNPGKDGQMAYRRAQAEFLDAHILRWFPAFSVAVRQQDDPFYASFVEWILEMVLDHRRGLGVEPAAALPAQPAPDEAILDDPKTGLKEIAGFLLTPARSGIYLSRQDITRLAQTQRLPRGFGSRQQMLTNLFHSAADYQGLGAVIQQLKALVAQWEGEFGQYQQDQYLTAAHENWSAGLARSTALLARFEVEIDA